MLQYQHWPEGAVFPAVARAAAHEADFFGFVSTRVVGQSAASAGWAVSPGWEDEDTSGAKQQQQQKYVENKQISKYMKGFWATLKTWGFYWGFTGQTTDSSIKKNRQINNKKLWLHFCKNVCKLALRCLRCLSCLHYLRTWFDTLAAGGAVLPLPTVLETKRHTFTTSAS